MRELDNVNTKRLQALHRSGAERIFQAYKWVQEHRSEFKKEVYGPVLLEVHDLKAEMDFYNLDIAFTISSVTLGLLFQVNVSNRFHADYLESHVAHYIWKVF